MACGQVYYFSKGKVKPANRNFAGVRNDYTINFDREYAAQMSELHVVWMLDLLRAYSKWRKAVACARITGKHRARAETA